MGARQLRSVKVSEREANLAAYDRLAALLFDAPLACTRERVSQIVGGVGPRLLGLEGKNDVEVSAELFGACLPDPDEVEITPEGVAIVPIRGTFAPRAGAYEAMSGMVSYEATAKTLGAIAANEKVKGLVLSIDSPGGAVAGVTEAADAVRAIGKPVYAVPTYQMTSAAYWLACEADEIFIPPTAFTGSIGVIAVRFDASKYDREQGFAYTFVTSGERKADGNPHKATTKDELGALQARIDQAAEMFFAAVAESRSMRARRSERRLSADAVAGLEGAVYMGAAAVGAGLADQVGTLAAAVAAMTKKVATPTPTPRMPGFGARTEEVEPMSKADTKIETPPADGDAAKTDKTETKIEAKVETPPAPADPVKAAVEQAQLEAREITALCTHFGHPDKANAFLEQKLTRAQVFEKLQADKVAAEGGDASARHAGGGDKTEAKLDPAAYDKHWNDSLEAAHKARPPAI